MGSSWHALAAVVFLIGATAPSHGQQVLDHSASAALTETEPAYDWSDEVGAVAAAKSIAQKCLAAAYVYLMRYPCVRKPTEICAVQYNGGRQNQHDINTCSHFSSLAWEQIVDESYGLVLKSRSAPKEIGRSQEMKAWTDLDCRTKADYIGTRSPLDYTGCRTKHASDRVFEFMQLLNLP